MAIVFLYIFKYYDIIKKNKKGSDNLIDLQEVTTKLEELDNKLSKIGDSL